MKPVLVSMAPSASSANGICLSQTPGGAGAVTINGALATGGVATLGGVSAVTITSTGDISNRTFDITGTDGFGRTLVLAGMTGPNATTVVSTHSFKTVTKITISGAAAAAITIGVNGTGISWPIAPDIHPVSFSIGLGINVTGTIDVTVQHTFDDVQAAGYDPYASASSWIDHTSLIAKTADTDGNYAFPCRGIRLKVNSSASGTVILTVVQSGTSSA